MTLLTTSHEASRDSVDERALLETYFDRLFPILRSITGDGVRKTHDILSELLPLTRIEIPSGTKCFDWTVPDEWVVREAYVKTPDGRRILDVEGHNLHLVNYSIPFRGRVTRAELDAHLYSLPDLPDAIPYVTSYYAPRWGFCIADAERKQLPEGDYDVVVDTALTGGAMTLSEAVLPGETSDEVLLSTYTCHPSMANNELSGPLVTALVYRRLAQLPRRRLTYRFFFGAETIGCIGYLSQRLATLKDRTIAGYVLTCLGDRGGFSYKRTRADGSLSDRAALHVLGPACTVIPYNPVGSDERQYNAPGVELPIGCVMRSEPGTYPGYHSSRDDKSFISFDSLAASVDRCFEILRVLDGNRTVKSRTPCEPQLGRRGLYPSLGTADAKHAKVAAIRWILSYADGRHDVLSIAERSGMPFAALAEAAETCLNAGLLDDVSSKGRQS